MNNVVYLRIPVALLGRWRSNDEDGRSEYVISHEEGLLKVRAIDFVDGEQYVVSDLEYDQNMVAFDTFMPSTGRKGHVVVRALAVPGRAEQTFTFTANTEMVRQDSDE